MLVTISRQNFQFPPFGLCCRSSTRCVLVENQYCPSHGYPPPPLQSPANSYEVASTTKPIALLNAPESFSAMQCSYFPFTLRARTSNTVNRFMTQQP